MKEKTQVRVFIFHILLNVLVDSTALERKRVELNIQANVVG